MNRLEKLKEIVESATPLLMEGYAAVPGADPLRAQAMGTSAKTSHKDLVTVFDRRVEEYLTDRLARAFPGEKVLGEEACSALKKKPAEIVADWDSFWVIDPIDGTTNYSRAYPFFCSTIGYAERQPDGQFETQIGVVWEPVRKEMFSAERGLGAWLNRERLRVTQVDNPRHCLFTTGFASERHEDGEKIFALFRALTKATLGVRRDGSAALDLAYVAAGRIDAYWEWGLSPWDLAAGNLLVEEAGGKVTHHDGRRANFMSGEVVATNGVIHPWLMSELLKKT